MRGFSLIEILLTTFIFSIISAGLILNLREGQRRSSLTNITQETALAIRKVQNYALTGERIVNVNNKTCGYGIRQINDWSFIVYQQSLSGPTGDCSGVSTQQILYNYNLSDPGIVKINNTGPFDLYFSVPFGQITFNSNPIPSPPSQIQLQICYRSSCNNYNKTIMITSGGSVEVSN